MQLVKAASSTETDILKRGWDAQNFPRGQLEHLLAPTGPVMVPLHANEYEVIDIGIFEKKNIIGMMQYDRCKIL